jgi:Undecaprenyl-phosphate glucose phosphotransferase
MQSQEPSVIIGQPMAQPPEADKAESKLGRRIVVENWITLFFVLDFMIFSFASLASDYLTYVHEHGDSLNFSVNKNHIIIVVFIQFMLCRILNVYSRDSIFEQKSLDKLFLSILIGSPIVLALAALVKNASNSSIVWLISWISVSGMALALFRYVANRILHWRLDSGDYVLKSISASMFCEPMSPEYIANITGNLAIISQTIKLNSANDLQHLFNNIELDEIDSIYIVVPWVDAPLILQQLSRLRQFSTRVYVVADEFRIREHHLGIGRFGDNVAITAVDRPIDGWGLWLKRVQDVTISLGTLVGLAPVLAIIALAIKFESPGPVLFKQKRTGFNGSIFEIWKFRSMYADKSDFTASVQTSKNDPRVTRVGQFIRKTSLDELPQLFNVLSGHMSIVGPRPHALQTRAEGQALEVLAEQYAARHRVKPGLTGWAQVCGYRGELDSIEKVRLRVAHDIEYIENWSTFFDLKIIAKTMLLVFHDSAAY